MISKELIIIGGGPAGLKAAQEARDSGLDYIVLEKGRVGQAWREIRPQMRMLSPCHPQRDWTSLNHQFPIWKLDVERPYCSAAEFVNYLQAFADFYNLDINEGSAVSSVYSENERFTVVDDQNIKYRAPFLLVSTGVMGNPFIPDIPGIKNNPCIMHSHHYQGAERFKRKRVLVVGAGNSSAEIAIELAGHSLVYLACRSELEFFSVTNKLYHIRGAYESYLKELIRMELIRYTPHQEIKRIEENRVFFRDWQLEVDKIIFATGYRSDFRIMQKLKTLNENNSIQDFLKDTSDVNYSRLYFAGALIGQPKSVVTIHSFIKYIPAVIKEITQKIQGNIVE